MQISVTHRKFQTRRNFKTWRKQEGWNSGQIVKSEGAEKHKPSVHKGLWKGVSCSTAHQHNRGKVEQKKLQNTALHRQDNHLTFPSLPQTDKQTRDNILSTRDLTVTGTQSLMADWQHPLSTRDLTATGTKPEDRLTTSLKDKTQNLKQ